VVFFNGGGACWSDETCSKPRLAGDKAFFSGKDDQDMVGVYTADYKFPLTGKPLSIEHQGRDNMQAILVPPPITPRCGSCIHTHATSSWGMAARGGYPPPISSG
jgi:hypothetical protein